jgi:hypothetical protein
MEAGTAVRRIAVSTTPRRVLRRPTGVLRRSHDELSGDPRGFLTTTWWVDVV